MARSNEKRLDMHRQTNQLANDPRLAVQGDMVSKGVSAAWLATAFGMQEQKVRYRLRACPIKTQKRRGTKMSVALYDLKTAAGFLIAPAFSTREYMKALKKGDLPPVLQHQ